MIVLKVIIVTIVFIIAIFIVILTAESGLGIVVFLAFCILSVVIPVLVDRYPRCPRCKRFFGRERIARKMLRKGGSYSPGLFLFTYRCKYCEHVTEKEGYADYPFIYR